MFNKSSIIIFEIVSETDGLMVRPARDDDVDFFSPVDESRNDGECGLPTCN